MVKREKTGLPWMIPAGLAVLFTSAVFTGQLAAGWISARLPLVPPGAPLELPERAYQDEVTAQEWSAFAGLLSSGVSLLTLMASVITLVILALTLSTTRRMVEAAQDTVTETRKIGRAQTRCYLSISELSWRYDWELSYPVASIMLHNTGNSPAIAPEMTIFIETRLMDTAGNHLQPTQYWQSSSLTSVPASTPHSPVTLEFPRWLSSQRPDLSTPNLRKVFFSVEVCITCNDVFEEPQSSFATIIAIHDIEEGRERRSQTVNTTAIMEGPVLKQAEERHRNHSIRYQRKN